MYKKAGYLKTLKKMKDFFGKGLSWVNNNIIKPLRPTIDTALDMTGYGNIGKKVLDYGSQFVDNLGYKTNNKPGNYIRQGADFLLDTQRSSQDRKYVNPFTNRLN